jgi:hypothetical protein
MVIFELKGSTRSERDQLRQFGYRLPVLLESLDDGVWNVICDDKYADDLRTVLEDMGVEHRFV